MMPKTKGTELIERKLRFKSAGKAKERETKRRDEFISTCVKDIKKELSDKTEEDKHKLFSQIHDICESKWNKIRELEKTTYSYSERLKREEVGGGRPIIPPEVLKKIDDDIRHRIEELKRKN